MLRRIFRKYRNNCFMFHSWGRFALANDKEKFTRVCTRCGYEETIYFKDIA